MPPEKGIPKKPASNPPVRQKPVAATAQSVEYPSKVADEAVATYLMRDHYTRERHYLLVRLILALSAALIISILANYVLATRAPIIRFVAMDREGRIVELTPLDKPINTLADVSTWVTQSVIQAYTFDFANYKSELSLSQGNFTQPGWAGFMNALTSSQVLQSVIDNKYVTTAAPRAAPVLLTQGLTSDGRYAWRFQLPIIVSYQSAQRTNTQDLLVDVVVVRQPETDQPRGLGIAQIIAQ